MRSTKSLAKPRADNPAAHVFSFAAIGTQWRIEVFQSLDQSVYTKIKAAVRRRIATFDAHYSRFRDDSLVMHMAQQAGMYKLPADAQPLFDLYRELYRATKGAMTPLIGQVLSDAGYNQHYSLRPQRLTKPSQWETVMKYDFPHLEIFRPVLLDLGAAGKGYLVDIIANLLQARGITAFCINAGGDMLYHSPAPRVLAVGLEHPAEPSQAIGVAQLPPGTALCGSAGNRRQWAQFHHIIHPVTLSSPRHLRAVWVSAASCLLADALTTALFFLPAPALQARYTFEYAVVNDDWSLQYSSAFPATFFSQGE